jgi:hypothetical protein
MAKEGSAVHLLARTVELNDAPQDSLVRPHVDGIVQEAMQAAREDWERGCGGGDSASPSACGRSSSSSGAGSDEHSQGEVVTDETKPQPDPRVHDYITVKLTEHIFARTVALRGTGYDGQPVQGSGACVQIGGRYFIATVAHVARLREDAPILVATEEVSDLVLRAASHGSRGHEAPFTPEDIG